MSVVVDRVLLVIGDAVKADAIAALLSHAPRVVRASTLAAACSTASTSVFDAIVLDARLPDGSGAHLVLELREAAHGIPIVVLTDDESIALACLAAGAEDCIGEKGLSASLLRRSLLYAVARTREAPERKHLAVRIRQAERIRIARDVHDQLGQLLTGIKLDLAWVVKRVDQATKTEIAERLTIVSSMVDATIAAVQRIARELRPAALDAFGLREAMDAEARRFEERTGVTTEVVVHSTIDPDAATATVLFFTLQELLTNVARHAGARTVRVELDDRSGAWMLRVEDDGIGIDTVTPVTESPGILGMRERAASLGGTFALERGARGGTLATVWVPSRKT